MGNCNACRDSDVSGEDEARKCMDQTQVGDAISIVNDEKFPMGCADGHDTARLARKASKRQTSFNQAMGRKALTDSSAKRCTMMWADGEAPGSPVLTEWDIQLQKLTKHEGFIAALDQSVSISGTLASLKPYGIKANDRLTEDQVNEKVHALRARVISHPKFDGQRIVACVMTDKSLDAQIDGVPCSQYLWREKEIVPLLKVDLGLQPEQNGVQLVEADMDTIDEVLETAAKQSVFGVKVRSIIRLPNAVGIKSLIDQQFQLCQRIVSANLVPILQPEIDVSSPNKQKCENVLVDVLLDALDTLPSHLAVALVLTIPTSPNLYLPLTRHGNILFVAALSGGSDRATACKVLEQNIGVVASFARGLIQDLTVTQKLEDFSATLDNSVQALYQASRAVDESVEMMARIADQAGFIAWLTKVSMRPMLSEEDQEDEEDMEEKLAACFSRIVTSDKLNSARVIAAVMMMEYCTLEIEGMAAARYLWTRKGIISFMVFPALPESERQGVQRMQVPDGGCDDILDQALRLGVFGVQLRGQINQPNQAGIDAILHQHFDIGKKMLKKGLMPNMLIEVDIYSPRKSEIEDMLLNSILSHLGNLTPDQKVTIALTIPSKPNLYLPLVGHPNVVRVGAPSRGYSCADTCRMLSENDGLIGTFGRAFTERLGYDQSESEFAENLANACKAIHQASTAVSAKEEQMMKINSQDGFFAIMDNTGRAVARALKRYGIILHEKDGNVKMHQMITRIVTNDHFCGSRVIGTVLSEQTMDLPICGLPSAKYLWSQKGTVPFLKIDNGLMPEANGVQLMQFEAADLPQLTNLLDRAAAAGIFGTKQRSLIKQADVKGIKAVIDQQLEMCHHVWAKGLLPILQPEVDINSTEKAACERVLLDTLLDGIERLRSDEKLVLLLTLPTKTNMYLPLMGHPNVIRLVALSGGYSQKKSSKMLRDNVNMIAGFGRAFVEGMSVKHTEREFSKVLENSCTALFDASKSLAIREEQLVKLTIQNGFFVGMDQDASTMPKMLTPYGVTAEQYANEEAMMEKAHQMCTRIITNTHFNGSRCIGIILTDYAIASRVGKLPCPKYLWDYRRIVPFMKLDSGLAPEEEGVWRFKEIRHLGQKIEKAIRAGIFGTICRSVIRLPSSTGIRSVVDQQMKMAKQVIKKGMVPIIQIEVDIKSPNRAKCERLLLTALMRELEELESGQRVLLDLVIPSTPGVYNQLIKHPNVVRVLAVSGGFGQEEACKLLEQNGGMIASFGRAFTEGFHVTQTDKEFTTQIVQACKRLFDASRAGGDMQNSTSGSASRASSKEEPSPRPGDIMGA